MIDQILDGILKAEGGLVDHPADRGGITNFGITLPTLSTYLGRPADANDIRTLTEKDARDIYRSIYVAPFASITDPKLLALIVDMAVNHGVSRAIKLLQHALSVTEDGIFGPKTLAALNASGLRSVYLDTLAERLRFYGRIITKDPSQSVFAAGWMNRAARFVEIG